MKEKKKKAVALRYDGKSAPRVTAKGEGLIAKKIIETAQEHGIPLQKNDELTSLLSRVRLNEEIPRSLYQAVAQILVFLYHVNGKKPKK
jgi:flagellar biosynthesis protein